MQMAPGASSPGSLGAHATCDGPGPAPNGGPFLTFGGGFITAVASQRGQGRVRGHGARLQRKEDGSLEHPRGVPCSATGLESSYCNFGAAVQEKCENYEGCYLLALKTYEARVPEIKIEEANRKVNWRVPQRIE